MTFSNKSKWGNYNGTILMLPKPDTKTVRNIPLPINNKLKLDVPY